MPLGKPDEKPIKQPYVITLALVRKSFNIHELRIVTEIIKALQSNMVYGKERTEIQNRLPDNPKPDLYVINLATKELLPDGNKNYGVVKSALKSLEQKVINIRGKDSHGEYETNARFIMKSKYYMNNQMVQIHLDPDLMPDILALAKNYSQYFSNVLFTISSVYAAKLYMYFSHWKDKTKIEIAVDSLREWLDLGDKYSKTNDFKKFILVPASIELKNKADVWFEIERAVKNGQTIVSYVCKIFKRGKNQDLELSHTQNIGNILHVLFDLREYHLKQLSNIIKRPELHPHIQDKIHEIKRYVEQGGVKHIKSYVVKALKNEFENNNENNK